MSRAAIFALKRASQATRNVMDERLAAYGLTSAQLDILLYLEKRGDSAQRDLQTALGITSATLTRILDGMVARGFVERRASKTDARAKLVTITAGADELLCRLQEEEERIFLARFATGFDRARATDPDDLVAAPRRQHGRYQRGDLWLRGTAISRGV